MQLIPGVFEKRAADLPALRKMTDALKRSGRLIRRQLYADPETFKMTVTRGKGKMPLGLLTVPTKLDDVFIKGIKEHPLADKVLPIAKRTVRGLSGGKHRLVTRARPAQERVYGGVDTKRALKGLGPDHVLNSANREAVSRVHLGHELAEMAVKPKRVTATLNQFKHRSPSVLLRESNLIATLPPELSSAAKALKSHRFGTGETMLLESLLPKGFRFGKQRLSRHAIKRMSELADAKFKRIQTDPAAAKQYQEEMMADLRAQLARIMAAS